VLAKPHAPQLIATKDNVTFGRLGPVLRASAEWMKGSSGLFVGSSFEGSTNGVNRFIAIMEDLHRGTSGKLIEAYTCKVVTAQMMYLYDYPYNNKGQPTKSPAFQAAFKADVAAINAWYKAKKTTKDVKETIDDNREYMKSVDGTFAEVGSTLINFHPDHFRYVVMNGMFPKMMVQARELLVRDGIFPADYVGRVGAPEAGPPPADIPSGKIGSRS
jgi:hypothetical protein